MLYKQTISFSSKLLREKLNIRSSLQTLNIFYYEEQDSQKFHRFLSCLEI